MVLSVCASAQEKPRNLADLAATHGFVRVSLPQWYFGDPPTLRGRRGSYELERMAEDGPYAYGAWLPAGRYDIVGTVAADGTPYTPIVVEAGRMTSLGALLRVPVGGDELVLLPISHPEADEEAQAAQGRLGSVLPSSDILRWQPTAPAKPVHSGAPSRTSKAVAELVTDYERRVSQPRLSKQMKDARTSETLARLARLAVPPATEEAAVDGAGDLYFGADLGQLRVRHPDGTWGSVDTGTLDEITAVAADGDRIVAGTLRGLLIMSTDRGQSWQRLRPLDPGEIVVDIDHGHGAWIVLSVLTDEGETPWGPVRQLRVHVARHEDVDDLAAARQFPAQIESARILGVSDALVGQLVDGAYIVNTVTGLEKLDLASMRWSSLTRPVHRIDAFHVSSDGTLITAMFSQGIFSKLSVSKDGGATWLAYPHPPNAIYDAVLETPDSGTATRWHAHTFSTTLEWYSYDAKAQEWRKTDEAPPGCLRLLRDESYHQRFCLTQGGSILDRKDGRWVAELAVE
jgi:hypothetical protein